MLNDLSCRERAEAGGSAMILSPRQADKKTRGKQVTGAGHIGYLCDRFRRHRLEGSARYHHAAFFAPCHYRKLGFGTQSLNCAVEIGGLVQTVQLALVGKNDIDGSPANQIKKFRALTVDTDRIG